MIQFPNESTHYRTARDKLLHAAVELRAQIETVAAMRRALPPGGELKSDCIFDEMRDGEVQPIRLSELFGTGHNTLVIYSFMFAPTMTNACPMCSSILDALNGEASHITQRVGLAVVAENSVETIQAFANERG